MAKRKKPKPKLKWWLLLIPIVAILLFAFYYKSLNNNIISPSGKSQSGAYQLYQNSEYKFSIQYPNNWELKNDTQVFEKGDIVAFRKEGPSQKKYTELSDGAQLAISKPFVIDTDLVAWMKDYFSPQAKFSKLPLNNYNFEVAENCGYMECMRYYFTKIDSHIYGIALYAEGTSAEKASYENALIYMLKSLTFTNATTESVSEEDAVAKVKALPEVKEYLQRVPNGLVLTNGEEDNAYMVQVYEFKNGHTATFNWYSVHKTTGEIRKEF